MISRDDRFRRVYTTYDLLEDERLVDGWHASGPSYLTLTTQRLLHEPGSSPVGIFTKLADLVGQGAAGQAIEAISGRILPRQWLIPLTELSSAGPLGVDQLRLVRTSGELWTLTLAASVWTPRWSAKNASTRDHAVATIIAALR